MAVFLGEYGSHGKGGMSNAVIVLLGIGNIAAGEKIFIDLFPDSVGID